MRHIGVDLHKTNFVACFIEADDTQRLETYLLTRDGLRRFRAQLEAADQLAVEATQNVHYFYDQVKAHVSRVAVVDTYRFGIIAKSKKKTDKADASALARFLKLGWLPEVLVTSRCSTRRSSWSHTRGWRLRRSSRARRLDTAGSPSAGGSDCARSASRRCWRW